MSHDFWTDKRVDLLKKWHATGLSASRIAAIIGDGATRGAVIGKIHRLNLHLSPPPARPRTLPEPRARKKAAPKPEPALKREPTPIRPVAPRPLPPRPPLAVHAPVVLQELRAHHCRWPVEEIAPRVLRYCGEPAVEGKSWCEHHCHSAYVVWRARRRAAA